MTNQLEALKMAIDWFEVEKGIAPTSDFDYIINACKEALALAEKQEPVAYIEYVWVTDAEGLQSPEVRFHEYDNGNSKPLYTHPATWQSLSDDEIFELHHKWIINSGNKDTQYDFARAIEQALKEKNHPCK